MCRILVRHNLKNYYKFVNVDFILSDRCLCQNKEQKRLLHFLAKNMHIFQWLQSGNIFDIFRHSSKKWRRRQVLPFRKTKRLHKNRKQAQRNIAKPRGQHPVYREFFTTIKVYVHAEPKFTALSAWIAKAKCACFILSFCSESCSSWRSAKWLETCHACLTIFCIKHHFLA